MISSTISINIKARVKFSKTNKSIKKHFYWSLKNLQVLIYSKLHEKNHVITYW